MEFLRVHPASIVEEAAQVLREAWPVPVLHYTPEYLRWQFTFPGPPSKCILAREDGKPAAFIALAPRRFRFRGQDHDGAVYSFLGVSPNFQGRGLAGQLYEEMMIGIRESGLPSVVFVEAHSPSAQRLLYKTVERLSFKLKKLGQYENYGYPPRARAAPITATATATDNPDDVLGVIASLGGDQVLWSVPRRAELEHYLRDPRPRKLVVIEEAGQRVGAAMIFLSEIATAQGFDRIPTLDTVFLPEPTADRLAAALRFTAAAFPDKATTPIVSAPNLATVPADVIKAAGLRKTGTVFDGFLLHGHGHPFMDAAVTNLEIV